MTTEKKIRWEDIKDGDKLKVTEYYSSYGANEQETDYFVTAKIEGGKKHLIQEDGREKFHGVNSSYQYFLIN